MQLSEFLGLVLSCCVGWILCCILCREGVFHWLWERAFGLRMISHTKGVCVLPRTVCVTARVEREVTCATPFLAAGAWAKSRIMDYHSVSYLLTASHLGTTNRNSGYNNKF